MLFRPVVPFHRLPTMLHSFAFDTSQYFSLLFIHSIDSIVHQVTLNWAQWQRGGLWRKSKMFSMPYISLDESTSLTFSLALLSRKWFSHIFTARKPDFLCPYRARMCFPMFKLRKTIEEIKNLFTWSIELMKKQFSMCQRGESESCFTVR